MYNGKTIISEDRVESFIAASKRLDVKEICTRFEIQKEEETLCIYINKEEDSNSETNNHIKEEEAIAPEQYTASAQPIPIPTIYVTNSSRSNICPDCYKVFHDSSNMKKNITSANTRE